MFISWRNGFLHIGPDYCTFDGWILELGWNRREDLNDPPQDGEVKFCDWKALRWYPGCKWPIYSSHSTGLMT